MAALGMGGRRARPWVPYAGAAESRTLAAVDGMAGCDPLVALGADVNAADADGRTALDEAEALQYESVVRYLAAAGAEPGID